MTNLLPPKERTQRAQEKRQLVLRWLREEIYTTREVVEELLGITASPAKATLTAMAREGLIRCEQVHCPSGWSPHLWGITADGQAQAFDPLLERYIDKTFEPGRVGLPVLKHTIHLQQVRLRAERAGWTEWQMCDRMGKWAAGEGRPDAIALAPNGERMAIEVELTTKTKKLYQSVLFARLRAIKSGDFDRCVWISPTPDRSVRLEAIVKSITTFSRQHEGVQQQVQIDPNVHHPKLAFMPLERWPHI